MESKILASILAVVLIIFGCSKVVVSLKPYEESILETTVFSGIPQLQSNDETQILKDNAIKSMSFVKEYVDSARLDSLTYLEFSRNGKLIQRTTTEVTSVGCLPQMIRQVFLYEDNRIKRVDNYTFKYITHTVLEKWLERDTSRLIKFDWEDYSYVDDTVIVESGFAFWTFIKDENGKLSKNHLRIKANNQMAEQDFSYTPTGLLISVKHTYRESTTAGGQKEYFVEINKVSVKNLASINNSRTENIYNDKGLLIKKNHFKDEIIVARTRIKYFYY